MTPAGDQSSVLPSNSSAVAAFLSVLATGYFLALQLAATTPIPKKIPPAAALTIIAAPSLWFFGRTMRASLRLTTANVRSKDIVKAQAKGLLLWSFLPVLSFVLGLLGTCFPGYVEAVWCLAAAGPFAIFLAIQLFRFMDGPAMQTFRRGRRLLSFAEAETIAASLTDEASYRLDWGGMSLPETVSGGHFCVIGTTGSGKTVSLRLLMQSVLPQIRRGRGMRAVVFDDKRDLYSVVRGMGLTCPVVILNPFDGRSASWDMARDLHREPALATQIAATLIPQHKEDSFFTSAARDLFAALLLALDAHANSRWTLRDALLCLSDMSFLKHLLESVPYTQHVAREYLVAKTETTATNVRQTISASIGALRPIAALWSQSRVSISLEDWAQGEYVLLLASDKSLGATMDALNRLLFQRAAELVLKYGSEDQRTWLFLDETKEAGRFKALPTLLTEGRTKGARVVMGFQDINGMRAVYGQELANEITGMCANKALLLTDDAVTAKFESETLGDTEWLERMRSTSGDAKAGDTRWSENISQRSSVLPSEFMSLPPADRRRFFGYFTSRGVGAYGGAVWFAKRIAGRAQGIPDFIPRPPSEQLLQPWTDADRSRLGDFFKTDLRSADLRGASLDGFARITI
ncbi:MAG: type IV secretion system DNA-binding domain-containing protein [Planctomycetes bacterium]|nr:type IV secretion system DNA-binding domain-containing protein [Planctomycetota bacterium]MBI3833469.1 type IV secretion system DNA-binding domain-containing protein [Planctomycetota bacterium]